MKVKAEFYKEGKDKLVKIYYGKETRVFKVFSARAGNCLCLLAQKFPEGITTKDMMEAYGIDDNKLFSELNNQSGFRQYMEVIGTKNRVNVWKLHLDALFENTKNLDAPIWFGMHEQANLKLHYAFLKKKQGLKCNILGIELLEETKGKFISELRKVAIDHRIPQLKKGNDSVENLQILSYYVNERKNQICSKCIDSKCEDCALAFPEKHYIIHATKENIKDILKKF